MRTIKLFSVMLLLGFLCACTEGENKLKIELSPQNKCVGELVSQIYNEDELRSIVRFEGKIEALDAEFPIECIRKCDSGYRVAYLGKKEIAILIFDVECNKISGHTYLLSTSKADFGSISEGTLLRDIQKLDSTGCYYFLYTGRNDVPQKSIHYTIDGYVLIIEYDESNRVVGITSSLI